MHALLQLAFVHEIEVLLFAAERDAFVREAGQEVFRPTRRLTSAGVGAVLKVADRRNGRTRHVAASFFGLQRAAIGDPIACNRVNGRIWGRIAPEHELLRPVGIREPGKDRAQEANKSGEVVAVVIAVAKESNRLAMLLFDEAPEFARETRIGEMADRFLEVVEDQPPSVVVNAAVEIENAR